MDSPMTAQPEPVDWTPPGKGVWARNFRLGEWLPDPVTPLFEDWLLPLIETGFLDGMEDDVGVRVPFRYGSVNGWYFNSPPIPAPRTLVPLILRSRGRLPWFLINVLLRVSSNPAAAHRAVLHGLELKWRELLLPEYKELVRNAESEVETASPARLIEVVEAISRQAGIQLWSLAVVGGSAWKMESALARFWGRKLAGPLSGTPAGKLGYQVLLRGMTGTPPGPTPHTVYSLDWYHPTAGEMGHTDLVAGVESAIDITSKLNHQRSQAEAAARDVLIDSRGMLTRFDSLLTMARYYAAVREEQALHLSLGWPVLRRCAQRLGDHLASAGAVVEPQDIHFLTLEEVRRPERDYRGQVEGRRDTWNRQKQLDAPLLIGEPVRFGGEPGRSRTDPVAQAVEAARTSSDYPKDAIIGHPASTGRASGRVRIMEGLEDANSFQAGEILVARSTAPAWTPLFARAAAVVTDGGTLAAHASIIAREYGIPAVVGTRDATRRLHTGQQVTVDGGAGYVDTGIQRD
ncbi:PEP-utilizing enzyme [Paenarthrobacter aurescens]|uniref:PEP-utilizing enzyme n=1 Tax=Paenarthrobacter aurescens TaxID=43663 RepID=UPI0021C1FA60|nr:PEP-utilizing enzyme [Paenarthrobacter aurescens]MCT9870880.1 PEP-utilizing enzyme [Paenarthrobacter aurescens]